MMSHDCHLIVSQTVLTELSESQREESVEHTPAHTGHRLQREGGRVGLQLMRGAYPFLGEEWRVEETSHVPKHTTTQSTVS